MHTLSRAEVEYEIIEAESLIEKATGQRSRRIPRPRLQLFLKTWFSILASPLLPLRRQHPPHIHRPLGPAGTSRKPTPAAKAGERADRRNMFGKFREGFRSLRPANVRTNRHRLDRRNPRYDLPTREAAHSH